MVVEAVELVERGRRAGPSELHFWFLHTSLKSVFYERGLSFKTPSLIHFLFRYVYLHPPLLPASTSHDHLVRPTQLSSRLTHITQARKRLPALWGPFKLSDRLSADRGSI